MSEIYRILILDDIECLFIIASVLSFLGAFGLFMGLLLCDIDSEKVEIKAWKWVKRLLIIALLSTLCNIFIPNSKQAAMIWGIGTTIDYI